MIYDNMGLYFSGLFFVIGIIRLLFQPSSNFFAPKKYINTNKKFIYKTIILILFICAVMIPSNIGFIKNKKIIKEKVLPVQILFDVSLSMAGTDIKPSRFYGAKESVLFLISKLKGYNISLITFSGKPLVYIPFSTNTKALISRFKNTVLADFNPTKDFVGTAIGDALLLGIKNIETLYENKYGSGINFKKKKDLTQFSPGIIILITDGDSNVGTNPLKVTPILKKLGIPVFTLGIGDKDFEVGKGKHGEEIIGYVNIPLLKKISEDTFGTFYKVKKLTDFYNIFDEISKFVKQQEIKKIQYQYFYINKILYVIVSILSIILLYMINYKKIIH